MKALAIAVVLFGALSVLNLLLLLGVSAAAGGGRIASAAGRRGAGPADGARWNHRPGHHRQLGRRDTCRILHARLRPLRAARLPAFIEYARTRERALAVVFDPAGNSAELVRKLEQVARVIVEGAPDGALQAAFQVSGYPATASCGTASSSRSRAEFPDLDAEVARIPA